MKKLLSDYLYFKVYRQNCLKDKEGAIMSARRIALKRASGTQMPHSLKRVIKNKIVKIIIKTNIDKLYLQWKNI